MIGSAAFSPENPSIFMPIIESLLSYNEPYMVLADYRAFLECHEKVSEKYLDEKSWTRSSILNTANMGKFSSDRTVLEYAKDIWKVETLE
jgi:starch phosphorylase